MVMGARMKMECKVNWTQSKGWKREMKRRNKIVNTQSLASVFVVGEHDPIWLRVVVESKGCAARKYVAKESDRIRG